MRKYAGVLLAGWMLLLAGCGVTVKDSERWWLAPPDSATHVAFQDHTTGKWGYKDRSGTVIVPPRFDYAASFPGDGTIVAFGGRVVEYTAPGAPLGRVKINSKWGYVDGAGTVVIEPRFDKVLDFFGPLTAAKIGGQWGYIDRSGAVVLPPRYDEASPFLMGTAHVRQGTQWYVIDPTGAKAGH